MIFFEYLSKFFLLSAVYFQRASWRHNSPLMNVCQINAIKSWKGQYSTHSFMYLCLQEWVRPVCSFLVLGVWVCYVSVQLLEGLVNDIDSQLQGFLHFGDELRLSLLPCLFLLFTSFFTLGWVFLADIFIIDSLSSKKLAGT